MFAGLQLSLIKWDFTQIPTDFRIDRILSIISKKCRQWQNIGLTQHSAGSSQFQPEVKRALNSDSGWTNQKEGVWKADKQFIKDKECSVE